MRYLINGIELDGPDGVDLASAHAAFERDAKPASCGAIFGEGVTDGVAYQVACMPEYACPMCRPKTEGGAFVDHLVAEHGFAPVPPAEAVVFNGSTRAMTIAETGTT